MATLPQPVRVSSPADYTVQLEIIQKIESLGGSAGYDSNPDAFSEILPALDPFKPDVWTKSIKELAEHENDRAAQALKAKLQAELDLHHSNPKLAQEQRIYKIIKGIEFLGGSVAFETFTTKATDIQRPVASATTAWPSVYAWGFAAGGVVITEVNMHTSDHEGTGYAWGPAFGIGNLQGSLFYESFSANSFYFQKIASVSVATAEFTLDGRVTSQFVGALIGVGASLAFGGNWHW